ncbi:hypothetical protein EB061_12220 [bacterium]|nr:hypothetical protein [bacterium]
MLCFGPDGDHPGSPPARGPHPGGAQVGCQDLAHRRRGCLRGHCHHRAPERRGCSFRNRRRSRGSDCRCGSPLPGRGFHRALVVQESGRKGARRKDGNPGLESCLRDHRSGQGQCDVLCHRGDPGDLPERHPVLQWGSHLALGRHALLDRHDPLYTDGTPLQEGGLMAQAEQEKTFDVSAENYFQAVADYEKYPEFVEGMKKVRAERQMDGSVLAVYDFSMMGKDMSYTLRIQENPAAGEVRWSLVKSDFFKVNNGSWKIEATGPASCKVRYSLEVDFSFSVPSFILKGVVKGTLPSMMNSFYERARKA